jgi:transposase
MNDEQHLFSQSTHWVGVDVSKRTFDAGLVRHGQKWPATPLAAVPVGSFARTSVGVNDFLQWLDALLAENDPPLGVRVVMEATGRYSSELAVWMLTQRQALAPAIAPPHQTAAFIASMGLRNKTDKLEARALGFYGMERQPPAYQPMTPQEAELRELARYRDFLVRERVAAGNRADETSACKTVRDMEHKRLRLLDGDIKRIEEQMRRHANETPELKRDVELLATIYGVGFITAVTIRVELGDLRRFHKARQLSAYAGLNPSLRQSGSSVSGRPHMNKKGNPRVRQCLYLAAMVAIRGHNDLQRTYRELRKQGKSAMSALGAIMRKLLVLMRAILISGKPFEPMWKTRPQAAQTP